MISVIVPIYNAERYLNKCIESILEQTYTDLEIILVDDGSTDHSGDICDNYVHKDQRVQVIHKTNGGLVSARKSGVSVAQGEYIAFVDADDWIENTMYENLYQMAEKENADIVLGGYLEDVNGKCVPLKNKITIGTYEGKDLVDKVHLKMLCYEPFFSLGIQPYLWNKLMKRNLAIDSIMIIDESIKIGEDIAAVMPMIMKATKVVITDYCEYHYCIRNNSMMWSNRNEEKEFQGVVLLDKHLRKTVENGHTEEVYENQINHFLINNLLTRVYSKVAKLNGSDILWPFGWNFHHNKCIIYGAGNFGRAVYNYLKEMDKISLFIDRDYEKYQTLQLSVSSVEELRKYDEDILVAVLDDKVSLTIKENLVGMGISEDRIYLVEISDENIVKVITGIEIEEN